MRRAFIIVAAGLAALLATATHTVAQLTHVTTVGLGAASHDIKVVGGFAYVSTNTGLSILSLANPAAPVVTDSVAVGAKCEGVDVRTLGTATYAFLACQTAGVFVVDVTNPSDARLVGSKRLAGNIWDVASKGHYVYATSFNGELFVLDVTDPRAPRQVAVRGLIAWHSARQDATLTAKMRTAPTSGGAKSTSVAVVGDILLTNDWNYGRLYAFDITNPANPVFAGTHYVPFVLGVDGDVAKQVAYIVVGYGRFSGVYTLPMELLDPFAPTRYNTCSTCAFLKSNGNIDMGGLGLSPGGDHLFYLGGYSSEFHVVDVSVPAALHDLASTTLGPHGLKLAETMGAASAGDFIYATAGNQGVRVYAFPGASD
jgi:hypothetical protein